MQIYKVFLRCWCDKCGKEIGSAQLAYQFPVSMPEGWLFQFQLSHPVSGMVECLECTKKAIAEAAKEPEEEEREYKWED